MIFDAFRLLIIKVYLIPFAKSRKMALLNDKNMLIPVNSAEISKRTDLRTHRKIFFRARTVGRGRWEPGNKMGVLVWRIRVLCL